MDAPGTKMIVPYGVSLGPLSEDAGTGLGSTVSLWRIWESHEVRGVAWA
jgi:hypothetical protein